jgi:hypothetical protein
MPSVTLRYHRRIVWSLIGSFILLLIIAGLLLNRLGILHIGKATPAHSAAANLEAPDSAFADEEEGVVTDLPNEEHVVLPIALGLTRSKLPPISHIGMWHTTSGERSFARPTTPNEPQVRSAFS